MTENSLPFCDISSLYMYPVVDTCLMVTRPAVLTSPILESDVQFHVSPSTLPFASITSPVLSNPRNVYTFSFRSYPMKETPFERPLGPVLSHWHRTKNPPEYQSHVSVALNLPPRMAP